MKKFVYLCVIINLISINMMSQNNCCKQLNEPNYCDYVCKRLKVNYPADTLPCTPGWRYDSILSDEFDSTCVNNLRWEIPDRKFYKEHSNLMGYLNAPNCIWIEDGKLMLQVIPNEDSLNCYYAYNNNIDTITKFLTGSIISRAEFRYGYIETECYLPKNHHYWPCFWTIGSDDINYSEVDVFERTNSQMTDSTNIIRQNCYTHATNQTRIDINSKTTQILTFPDSITGRPSMFGVEILPKELVFYINGHVTSRLKFNINKYLSEISNLFTCTNIEEMIKVKVRLTMNCHPNTTSLPQPEESAWFGYFRYYRLERGNIETYHPAVFTPSNESTKVYPHIILGGTGYTANVTTPTAIWAEQDIVFDKGFQVSAGTAFTARIIEVPDPDHSPLYKQNNYY